MSKNLLPRELVLKILVEIEKKDAYINIALKRHLDISEFNGNDKRLITELVHGIIKNRIRLDYIISQFSKIRIGKLSKWVHNILRIGIYQMIFLTKIPDYASCNECVKLTKKYSHKGSIKYVNGVLRNISRHKTDIKYPDEVKEPLKFLNVMYSFPNEILEYLIDNYGYNFAREFCAISSEPPAVSININTLKTKVEKLKSSLKSQGVKVQEGIIASNSIYIKETGNILDLSEFKNGLFHVQGETSMLVSQIIDPKPGDIVMDVCAAPGGKTAHLAQLMNNKGKIYAFDLYPHKIDLINKNIERLELNIVESKVQDAQNENTQLHRSADKVLVDAPCTGWGIIRKKPDIKWNNYDEKTLNELQKLQLKILNTSSSYVKKGGILVYSTCTIRKEENEQIVEKFLNNNKDFVFCDIKAYIKNVEGEIINKGSIQIYPNIEGLDGFFICKLKRI